MSETQKVIVITGVSSGLGAAMAAEFKAAGHRVVGASRSFPTVPIDLWLRADITLPADRQRIVDDTLASYGRIDVLVNNAGIGCYQTWEDLREEDLRAAFELNLFAPILLAKLCLPHLLASGGSLINISSVAGKLYVPCMGPYCATKAALTFFSNTLRAETAHRGLHVLDMVVGRISTGFSLRSLGGRKPPSSPGGGNTTPEDLAKAVYTGWRKRKRAVTYPGWNRWIVPLLLGPLNRVYENENRKRWGL
jgi:short-subunit dehydrogenase